MTNIPSAGNYIQIEGARTRSPVSENLVQTMGGTTNYLLDQNTARISDIATINGRLATDNKMIVIYNAQHTFGPVGGIFITAAYIDVGPGTIYIQAGYYTFVGGGAATLTFTPLQQSTGIGTSVGTRICTMVSSGFGGNSITVDVTIWETQAV